MTKKVYVVSYEDEWDDWEKTYESKEEALIVFGKALIDEMKDNFRDNKYWDGCFDIDDYKQYEEYFLEIQELLNSDKTDFDIDYDFVRICSEDYEPKKVMTVEEYKELLEKSLKEVRETKIFRGVSLTNGAVKGHLIQTEEGLKILEKETGLCYNIIED